jgi:hypothetical protein
MLKKIDCHDLFKSGNVMLNETASLGKTIFPAEAKGM